MIPRSFPLSLSRCFVRPFPLLPFLPSPSPSSSSPFPTPSPSSLLPTSFHRYHSFNLRPHFDYKALLLRLPSYTEILEKRRYSLPPSLSLSALYNDITTLLKLQFDIKNLRTQHNSKNKGIKPSPADVESAKKSKMELLSLDERVKTLKDSVDQFIMRLPNEISEETPIGDEKQFKVIETFHNYYEDLQFKKFISSPPSASPPLHSASSSTSSSSSAPPSPSPSPSPSPFRIPLDHLALSSLHSLLDFDTTSRTVGSRFVTLQNELSLLEMALINYSIQFILSKGNFSLSFPPDMIYKEFIHSAGFQPRDTKETQIYDLEGAEEKMKRSLIGTAEIAMAAYFHNKIIGLPPSSPSSLSSSLSPSLRPPSKGALKSASFSHCYRTESGGYGRDQKGLFRLHQFSKVEIFYICHPKDSHWYFNEILEIQKDLYKSLGIIFRFIEIPSGDLGAPAARKVDAEALMPGRSISLKEKYKENNHNNNNKNNNKNDSDSAVVDGSVDSYLSRAESWGEISSTSNCLDYQSRRMNIKVFNGNVAGIPSDITSPSTQATTYHGESSHGEFAHTLNGTAVAIPRMILAIMEQNQTVDGKIIIPKVLRPFMMGMETIPDEKVKLNKI